MTRWEGTVQTVSRRTFMARLRDLGDASLPGEFATFRLSDVPERDRGLVAPGAVFTWTVGRASSIRFRRRRWTRAEIERADAEASRMARLFS